MQGPEFYLEQLGLSVPCAMEPDKPAVLDEKHRSWVGHDCFFFSSFEAKEKFDADPLKYCGRLVDPITGDLFQPTEDSPKRGHNGRMYYFATHESFVEFSKNAIKWAEPRRTMDQ